MCELSEHRRYMMKIVQTLNGVQVVEPKLLDGPSPMQQQSQQELVREMSSQIS